MANLCLLECAICQQNLLQNCNQQEETNEGTSRFLTTSRNARNDPQLYHSWVPVSTPCGHLFHKGCIAEWFRIRRHYDGGSPLRGTCPTCRKVIAYHKLTRIYFNTVIPAGDATSSNDISSSSSATCSAEVTGHGDAHQLVREFPQFHRDPELSSSAPTLRSSANQLRVFADLISTRNSRNVDLIHSHRRLLSLPNQLLLNRLLISAENRHCMNTDCVELQNVYQTLMNDFKDLQRKLELEIDVSKMKSILVTALQNDVEKLRGDKESLSLKATWICVVLWMLCCFYCILHKSV